MFMGLETYMSENSPRRIRLQRALVERMILAEQARQRRASIEDPEEMARVAGEVSGWSRTIETVLSV